jgi:hypothetical protein
MNHAEYLEKVKQLESDFEMKKISLMKEFVVANNPYKVGDTVTDLAGTILIESMGFAWGANSKPCATYYGPELKKDGTPKKNRDKRRVWQSNVA